MTSLSKTQAGFGKDCFIVAVKNTAFTTCIVCGCGEQILYEIPKTSALRKSLDGSELRTVCNKQAKKLWLAHRGESSDKNTRPYA